jgi:excisionase family DNA binding protein
MPQDKARALDDWLTIPEAHRFFGGKIGLSTLYSMAARNELHGAMRFGRRILISRSALEAWLATQLTGRTEW